MEILWQQSETLGVSTDHLVGHQYHCEMQGSKSFDPWLSLQGGADLDQKLRFFYLFDKVENWDDQAWRQEQKGKKASENQNLACLIREYEKP